MPLFRTGRQFNPFGDDEASSKRQRLDFAEGVLSAAGLPEVAGLLESVDDTLGGGDQIVPTGNRITDAARSRSVGMARTRGRRGWRGRRRRKRQSLKSKMFRSIIKYKERHDARFDAGSQNLAVGDVTTPVIRVYNPSLLVGSGDTESTYIGNTWYLRGYRLRAFIASGAAIAAKFTVQVRFFSTHVKSDTTVGGTLTENEGVTYGSTTTTDTNPAQSGNGEENIPIFDDTARPFTGLDPSTTVNTDYIRTIRLWNFHFQNYGVATTDAFKTIDIWMPINRIVEVESIEEGVASPAAFLKGVNYYYTIQVHAQSPVASGTIATISPRVTVYFRDF